jgi:hypothetical protein
MKKNKPKLEPETDNLKKVQAVNYANVLKKLKAGKTLSASDMKIVEDYEAGKSGGPGKNLGGRPPKGSQELPVYTSMGQAAASTGIPLMVLKRAKDEGCSAFRFSRIELGKLLPWLFRERQTELPLESAEMKSARSQVDEWTAKIKKLDYEERVGLMVAKDDVRHGLAAIVPAFFEDLDRVFRNEMPPKLVGLRELEIRAKCAEKVEQFKASLHISFAKLLELTKPDGEEDK